ncbi:protein of unknown function [Bradyrhizobium sp. ORS 285]|uniref:hypothetical protein n=1 Tax=Bradyrhizobium sp. ORS 285 TaxID=115808 RepID=UPI0002408EE5|nr:hypothetical protein [Bradyrhizobium sp. ORS 285]CCD84565.1 hypothetical protein BRAO285_1220051 [Bradyrhizobium sp. ORS 285]SMX57546.1 protein of unknown function [Bradyrhizobium sp. ORS 285]
MKIFWSWQSDTPGRTGRHFVRAALDEVVSILKQPPQIEEPAEREARDALHVDQDRQGVSGSPDLARTIFSKIELAEVFIADVTLIGESIAIDDEVGSRKKVVNPNVAIEYGFAERAIGDQRILLVQNDYYGGRNSLPFDLRHKAGPIRFHLPPDASEAAIKSEKRNLRGSFITALRPFIGRTTDAVGKQVVETPALKNIPAYFADSGFVLASVGNGGVNQIDYRMGDQRVFYLRLIPTKVSERKLTFSELQRLLTQNRLHTLSRNIFSGAVGRNAFGSIVYEPHGESPTPRSFTQLFRNGEIWTVGTGFHQNTQGGWLVPARNVQNIFSRVLQNFCDVASESLGLSSPYTIEFGGLCLAGARLSVGVRDECFGPIHQSMLVVRSVLNNEDLASQQALVERFVDELFDLAGADRPASL